MDFELSAEPRKHGSRKLRNSRPEIAPYTEEHDRELVLLGRLEEDGRHGTVRPAFSPRVRRWALPPWTPPWPTMPLGPGGGDAGMSLAWGANAIIRRCHIWMMGTEEHKKKFLPGICAGELVSCFGLTEPDAGSDAASVQTTAIGRATSISSTEPRCLSPHTAPSPTSPSLSMVTDKSKGANGGISAFIVGKGLRGLLGGPSTSTRWSSRTSPTSELIFSDCKVPASSLLGPEGYGFYQVAKATLEWERAIMVAPAVGGIEANIERCIQYAKERVRFGAGHRALPGRVAQDRGHEVLPGHLPHAGLPGGLDEGPGHRCP